MKALHPAACYYAERGNKEVEPIKQVSDKVLYEKGEYSVRPTVENAYLHMWKNVILTTLCGVNRPLIDALAAGKCEDIITRSNYDICTMVQQVAPEYAKKYNFQIK